MADQSSYNITADEEVGQGKVRLDKYLSMQLPDISRTRIKSLILGGFVKKSGQVVTDCSEIVKSGDIFDINVPELELSNLKPLDVPLNIVFEDDAVIVLDKQAGLTVHPGAGNFQDTLVNALLHHCQERLSGIGGVLRPGIVHRLDKDTSGLMVIAKNDKAHHSLAKQIENRTVKRIYNAFVWGVPSPMEGTIEANIGRSEKNRKKMAVVKQGGKTAITHYKVVETFGVHASRVECRLQTGRTHQIRVHMAHIGHTLIGDKTYGRNHSRTLKNLPEEVAEIIREFPRQALHSVDIGFTNPGTGKHISFHSEFPEDMNKLLKSLKTLQYLQKN